MPRPKYTQIIVKTEIHVKQAAAAQGYETGFLAM